MTPDDTQLTATVTVGRYRELEQADDRQTLAQFVRDRFQERYFRPIESAPVGAKHGFATMAVCCIVIETLESFYRGMGDTRSRSRSLFASFFARQAALQAFDQGTDWFYCDIRCGLLHQSEARNGWRIRRDGPLLDSSGKQINATEFIRELITAVDDYANRLQHDDELWALFKKKMKTSASTVNNHHYRRSLTSASVDRGSGSIHL